MNKSPGNARKTSCFAWNKSKSSDGCPIKVRTVSAYDHWTEFLTCLLPSHVALELKAEVCFQNTATHLERPNGCFVMSLNSYLLWNEIKSHDLDSNSRWQREVTVRLSGPSEVGGSLRSSGEMRWCYGNLLSGELLPPRPLMLTFTLPAVLPVQPQGTAAAAEQENLFHDSEPQQKNSRPGYCFV